MAFRIPNEVDALVPAQAQIDNVDIIILDNAFQQRGIINGLTVSWGGAGLLISVSSGNANYGATPITYAGGSTSVGAGDALLPRFDLVVINTSAVMSIVAGTPASSPVFPAIPSNSIVLGAVYVPAGASALTSANIIQKSVPLDGIFRGGRPNGQTIIGGTATGQDLSLSSNTLGDGDVIIYGSARVNLQVGTITDNFYLTTSGANPVIQFDTNDVIVFNRSANELAFYMGGIADATNFLKISASGMTVDNEGLTDKNTFIIGALSTVRPAITFDAGTDALFYDRTSNFLEFRIANAAKFNITSTVFNIPIELDLDGALNHDGTTVGFYGVTPVARPAAYTITNDLTDRAYDANTVAIAELADVVATVIRDLIAVGILQ